MTSRACTKLKKWQRDWDDGMKLVDWKDAYKEVVAANRHDKKSQLRTAVTMRQGLDKSLKPRKETKKAKVHYEYLLPPKPESKHK